MPRRAALLLLLAALGGLATTVPRVAERDLYSRLLASTVWVHASNHGKGTGWVVDRGKRWVVTCYHVVGEAEAVEVTFPWRVGGRVVSPWRDYLTHAPELRKRGYIVRAKVLRRNPHTDLALLELASLPKGAADRRAALRSLARLLRDQWEEGEEGGADILVCPSQRQARILPFPGADRNVSPTLRHS